MSYQIRVAQLDLCDSDISPSLNCVGWLVYGTPLLMLEVEKRNVVPRLNCTEVELCADGQNGECYEATATSCHVWAQYQLVFISIFINTCTSVLHISAAYAATANLCYMSAYQQMLPKQMPLSCYVLLLLAVVCTCNKSAPDTYYICVWH